MQRVCACTVLTIKKAFGSPGKNPIAQGDRAWSFAGGCEGAEQLGGGI